jgi:hypothetical protein
MPLVLSGTNGISTNGTTWALTPDSSGRVRMPNQPAFAVRGNQTGTVASGAQLIFTDSASGSTPNIVFNQGNYWNNSTSYFTAPVAGIYQFNFQIYIQNATTAYQSIAPLLNGAQMGATDAFISFTGNYTTGNGDNAGRLSYIMKMAAGDTTGLVLRIGASAALSVYAGHTWYQGYLIG